MLVATYEPDNQQMNSNAAAFHVDLQYIKSFEEITSNQLVFCVDKQTAQEIGNLYFAAPLKTFTHKPNATYIFGENNSQKLSKEIIKAQETSTKEVFITTIPGKTLWTESAMAIVLYHIFNE